MRLKFTISVLLYIGVLGCFTSCQKELTCWGAECPGIAVYSFLQNNGACTNALVNGTYKQETELNDSNTVAVKVNVTKQGAYSISTDTINGFYFRGEGSFSGTGLTTVILKSIGTPFAAGNFNFISSKTSGCNFKIKVDTIPFVEKYFYDITIDGIRYTQTVRGGVKINNYYDPGSRVVILSNIGDGGFVGHQNGRSSISGFGIYKGFIQSSLITLTGLDSYFAVGYHNFSSPGTANGISIVWVNRGDPAYPWDTYSLPGTQAGSNFIIDSVQTYTDTQGRPIAKVKATFNCILYNGKGASKLLTNGKFYGEFANILR